MLQFPSNALPDHIEEFLVQAHVRPQEVLRMPVKLEHGGGLGTAVHATQAIATWSALGGTARKTVALSPSFVSEATRDRVASTLPGMAALYFADSVAAGQHHVSRFEALEAVAPRVRAMQSGDFRNTLRGLGVALVCFAGAKNEFLSPLYSQPRPGSVRGHADFQVLLQRILSQLGSGSAESLNEGQFQLLSALAYQLFANTDEHGSNNITGKRLTSAMRGLTVRLTALDDVKSLVGLAGEDAQLRGYLAKLAASQGRVEPRDNPREKAADKKSPIRLLELSVFDTGPGLALNWLSQRGESASNYQEFSTDRELDAVFQCFEKHATTKSAQFSGLGLTSALMAMKSLKAFMSLRCGRLSLYQDFSRSSTDAFDPKPRYHKTRTLPVVAGTGYSIWFRMT